MRASARRAIGACLLVLALSACKTELYTDLSEREANQMIAALMEVGIPASKDGGADGVSVLVDESRFGEAITHLKARGLPSQRYENMRDVFPEGGIVPTPIEERARYIYALSQELSQTVGEIDGVLSARIHVVLPETDMLGRDFKPSSASVFIKHAPDAPVEQFTSQIKLLVANSIEGLQYDNITVVTVPAAVVEVAETSLVLEQVAGIWVHPASVQRLWMTIGGLAMVALACLALAALPYVRSLVRGTSEERGSA